MRAVLIGAVESTRVALEALAGASDWEVAAVVTLPLELASRHSDFVDLAPVAEAAGCRMVRSTNANDPATIEFIEGLAPDYLFVIGWSQLCGDRMMAIAPGRTVGYHPAPLPRLRGRGVIPWTILLEEPITAGTLFLIDQGVDSGAILAQHFFHVASDETAATLYHRHMAALTVMLPPVLDGLANGTIEPRAQDDHYATWASRRRPEDGEIDWTGAARDIWRLVRACGPPYPGALTQLGSTPLIITAADHVAIEDHRAALTGQIVLRDEAGFIVRCGDGGGLRVTAWQWDRAGPPPLHAKLGST